MVFSSIPVYVDPPNWHHQQQQQQPNHHHQLNGISESLPPLPPQVTAGGGGGGVGSIRAGSMADRARLAKMPPPEPALKCPRCDSTNTKFCYFNNYSLSQPRHFCKACRRYWTRGGALRNVPVGGGCRRNNKKNKRRSRSKSPPPNNNNEKQSGTTLTPSSGGGIGTPHHEFNMGFPQTITNLPFMASLQNFSRYGGVGNMDHHMGFHHIGGSANSGVDQWRLQQQFPNFLNGFESNSSSYPTFHNNDSMEQAAPNSGLLVGDIATSSRVPQIPPVKMEENGAMNLSMRSSLNNVSSENNNQFYSWTDLSGLAASSSTTTHDLL